MEGNTLTQLLGVALDREGVVLAAEIIVVVAKAVVETRGVALRYGTLVTLAIHLVQPGLQRCRIPA